MQESIETRCVRYRAERDCARQEASRALQDYSNARVELCAALSIDTEAGWSDAMAEMGRRLMPEGYEWPLDAKGVQVLPGDTVWANGFGCGDGRCWHVRRVSPGKAYPVGAVNEIGEERELKPWWVTHERPAPKVIDADGAEIRVGDRVWDMGGNGPYEVTRVTDQGYVRIKTDYGFEQSAFCERLTHERPDSWERLEEDVANASCPDVYCANRHIDASDASYEWAMARDIVHRAKALAERGK